MPIKHVYEHVVSIEKMQSRGYQLTLDDNTIIHLPMGAWMNVKEIREGDRVLIDFENERLPQAAMISIFRDFQLVTSFGVNRGYIEQEGT